jgi:predicted GIY-YIG superfamily endonuclease
MQTMTFLFKPASTIAASSLRITAIYFQWIILVTLLYFGVLTLLFMSLGSEVGAYVDLFQVTTFLFEGKEFLNATVLDLFVNRIYCEGSEYLPVIIEFKNLHLTEHLVEAYERLKGLPGVYCVKNLITGALYIGSSINMASRIRDHITDSSNVHLKSAIKKYGILNFVFLVVEFVDLNLELTQEENKAFLLSREQFWLNWLFTLPAALRYNFYPSLVRH